MKCLMVLMLMVAPVFAQKQSPVWKPPCVLADSACWNQINPPAEPGAMLSYVERKLQRPDDIQEATAKATIPPKSEFETTQQYELRKAQAQDSLFLFLTDIDFEYDADHQTITAKVGLGTFTFLLHSTLRRFQLTLKRVGGELQISDSRYSVPELWKHEGSFAIAFGADGLLSPLGSAISMTFSWPLSIEDAKVLKPTLKMALVCKQTGEAYTDSTYAEATIGAPYDVSEIYHFLPVTVVAAAAFDSKTGKVVKLFQ